jgi:regulator of sirC expression with transglutaminase-like and TPR domain
MSRLPRDVMACRSLAELVAHPDARAEHVALWIARDAHPQLLTPQVSSGLDALAHDMAVIDFSGLDAKEQAAAITHHLGTKHGFQGNRRDYYDAENHYLDAVLKRKLGIPITLAIVYLAVAERLHIRCQAVGFPGHFLVRIGDEPSVLVDPFDARVLSQADLGHLLTRALGPGSQMKPEYLEPIGLRAIAQRMLQNLKRIHEGRKDRARALLVTDRLVEVANTPEHRRDRGLYALALGANQAAATDLAHYLLQRPNAPDAKEIRNALERSRRPGARVN